jgi:hypothetical protein
MKTSGRRPFLEIAPHTITAGPFWYRKSMIFFPCKLITVDHFSALTGRFHGLISSLQLIFWLLDDRSGGNGPFLVRIFTFSWTSSFNVTFDSPINEISLHIKPAEITEDSPTGLILKIFFYDQIFHGGHCVRLVSASAFSTEAQIFFYTMYQIDNGPNVDKNFCIRIHLSPCKMLFFLRILNRRQLQPQRCWVQFPGNTIFLVEINFQKFSNIASK